MFFLYNLERRVTMHPSYLGRDMRDLVTSKLLKDVEGTCAGNYFIISIMDAFDISEGKILPGSGLAEFTVSYRAVVWRPFKGETVDAVVYSVNPHGFFANAGPLRMFVSAHLIPADIKYDSNATPPQFTNNDDSVIAPGTHVRVKVIGTRTEVGEMWAIGSIKEDYLGYVQFLTPWPHESNLQHPDASKRLRNAEIFLLSHSSHCIPYCELPNAL